MRRTLSPCPKIFPPPLKHRKELNGRLVSRSTLIPSVNLGMRNETPVVIEFRGVSHTYLISSWDSGRSQWGE